MTIQTRKPKLNQMLDTVNEIYRRNDKHRVYSVTSLTSGKPYQVITDWSCEDGTVTINCKLFSFEAKYQFNHPANNSQHICCQFLASVKWAARQAGKVLSIPDSGSFKDAKRLLNLGGQLVRIVNQNGVVWGVAR